MPGDLRTLQQRFFFAISGRDRCHGKLPVLSDWLVAAEGADVALRTGVYASAHAFRLLDCLAGDFPSVAAMLGDAFDALADAYVARHPPSHPSLRHLGASFASFAAEHPLSQRWPWLGDLAALDWARVEAFDARDTPLLTLDDLAAIAPDEWPARVFRTAPPVRLLTLRHPVHLAWRAVEDATPVPALPPRATHLLVWRRGHAACHRVADAREADALRCAQRGAPFADLCERVAADGSVEQGARDALGLLQRWIAESVLAAEGEPPRSLAASRVGRAG